MKRIFVTGISTEVGKTIASAIFTEALQADYWKPVQAGDLSATDSHKVQSLVTNRQTRIYPSVYSLKTPISPHAAAHIDGVEIDLRQIREPETRNHLIIEGAGGILVPLNDHDTIFDLIKPHYTVVVVSRHYLGSINHTLLTVQYLIQNGFKTWLLFNGPEHPTTERIILKKTALPLIGRIGEERNFDKTKIAEYAGKFRSILESL